jgi:flagellar biosynthesis/type III secretory pathway chaperone
MTLQAQKMLDLLTKQLKLNKSLLQIAQQKTDILKTGDIKVLNTMMKDEQTHIAAINQLEQVRKKEAVMLLGGHPMQWNEPTLSDLLDIVNEEEREKLQTLQKELVKCIHQLKERNALNQELIMQSMQFINLNLDMLSPQMQIEAYNYQKEETQLIQNRSLFNSKA